MYVNVYTFRAGEKSMIFAPAADDKSAHTPTLRDLFISYIFEEKRKILIKFYFSFSFS
jgi:hypothetical protein